MYAKILFNFLLVLWATNIAYSQNVNDTLLSKNGTYRGTYIYKNNKFTNTEFIRILFINDTTFAYTIYQNDTKNETAIEANFYYNYSPGIARLRMYKNKKIWIGIQDMQSILLSHYTDTILEYPYKAPKFNKAVNYVINNPNKDFNSSILMTNFIFKNDSVYFDFLNDCCHASREGTRFGKIDNKKLRLGVDNSIIKYDSSFSVSTKTNSIVKRSVVRHDYNNFSNSEFTIKSNCTLTILPIPEKGNSNKITGYLKAGEKVRTRPLIYMNYVYVGQLDTKDKFIVTKSGWLPIDCLQK